MRLLFVWVIFIIFMSIFSAYGDVDVNVDHNLTSGNSLIINISISHPHERNISEVKLTMYNSLYGNIIDSLTMDIFQGSNNLCAQRIKETFKCSIVLCTIGIDRTGIILLYAFPRQPILGIWHFQFEYYDDTQNVLSTVQKKLNLEHFAITSQKLEPKLKIENFSGDKVEVSCYSKTELFFKKSNSHFPLTKVGFGLNNYIYFTDLYQRNGDPYGLKCVHGVLADSATIHEGNNIKCFDVVNLGKDNRLCSSTEDWHKPLFLFSDRENIPAYFAGHLSFINPIPGSVYSHIPQNIVFETDIRSCFQVPQKSNDMKNLCLTSSVLLQWLSIFSRFVIQYESLTVWSTNQTNYQCPGGIILTIIANDCFENDQFENNSRSCNESAGFTIYHNDTLHLKPVEARNECITNFILCFQNPRQRPGYVYLFPSSNSLIIHKMFNPIQVTNLNFVHQCPVARVTQNLLKLEDEILKNASSIIPNIVVKTGHLHCDCEQKPFTCFGNATFTIARMSFDVKDIINSNSVAFCFIGSTKSPVINLNRLLFHHLCDRNTSKYLQGLYAPVHLTYSVTPDFPLITFSCTNNLIDKGKKVCELEDHDLMRVTIETQYRNVQSISNENVTLNLNYLNSVDKFNRMSCSKNSSVQHNIPIRDIIMSVMSTYCANFLSPYRIHYTSYNNTHVVCSALSVSSLCNIELLNIAIGSTSCSSDTCLENLRTERLLVTDKNSTSLYQNTCTVYYRYHNPQGNVIPIKQSRSMPQYTYKSNSVFYQQSSQFSLCSSQHIAPVVVMKRYFKHVLVTSFLDNRCNKDLPFIVNVNIVKLNSIIHNYDQQTIIYAKTTNSRELQTENNHLIPDDGELHFSYDYAEKAILVIISDSFIHDLIHSYQSPIMVHVLSIYKGSNMTGYLEVPIWMFGDLYKDQYNRYTQDKDQPWPIFKPRSQLLYEKDQVGLFIIISFPVTFFIIISLVIITLSCVLYKIKPLTKEHLILQNMYTPNQSALF